MRFARAIRGWQDRYVWPSEGAIENLLCILLDAKIILGVEGGQKVESSDPYTNLRVLFQYHPDKLGDRLSEAERAAAVHTFQRITKAYELLSNPEQRTAFDVKASGVYIHNYITPPV